MKPVYQTVVDPNIGNCMQAVVASMFELPLNKVPNFIESAQWALDLYTFFEDRNYDLCCWQPYTEDTLKTVYKKVAKSLTINGALYVAVPSSLYKEGLHAVLINNRGGSNSRP